MWFLQIALEVLCPIFCAWLLWRNIRLQRTLWRTPKVRVENIALIRANRDLGHERIYLHGEVERRDFEIGRLQGRLEAAEAELRQYWTLEDYVLGGEGRPVALRVFANEAMMHRGWTLPN